MTRPLQIGVDATCCANGRGYGRYTRELLQAMVDAAPDERFHLFLDARADQACQTSGSNVIRHLVPQRMSPAAAASADGYRAPDDMLRFTRAVWRARPDVFFSPSVYTYFPLPPRQRAAVTIHDAIAERFPELTLPSRRARLFWSLKVRLALHQARVVLSVSEYAAREVAKAYGLAPERVRVASEAPAAAYFPGVPAPESAAAAATHGVPEGHAWFTYVGGFGPHKHVPSIVAAHGRLVQRARAAGRPAPHLLLIGVVSNEPFHSDLRAIRLAVAAVGTEDEVHWTGFLPDAAIRQLHCGAVALLLVSASEGFGLPAVEAAACGCPVIATTESPLPELLAGGGCFVAPGDVAATAAAMAYLHDDAAARQAFGARAAAQAQSLSWAKAGRAAVAAIREAAA